ncbi:MaoC family dehydratase [Jhaorihella thermophila]|uniref:Acyl dehydratase n=1 Tax=Jhaorihella thermophila TaxID=488547 RepID=A0A1H5UHU5_9RHOB|nr:MaoC family dehydratase [Jhaorihella thermophila]SEF73837.1 Acyl dehydratase [Jhaorihella thermophila]
MAGLWFEDFTPGMVIDHAITRTITETDNMLFCSMTYNPQPLHIDRHFAERTEFGRPLVNSLFTLGVMIGISVHETTLGTTIANLGMTDVTFSAPVFHGDTLRVRTTVAAVRNSGSRPDAGIVTFRHEAFNQDGVLVASCMRAAFMHKTPARKRDGSTPS